MSSAPIGAVMAVGRCYQPGAFGKGPLNSMTVSSPGKASVMVVVSRRQAALRGFGWGVIAGLALVALMYLANLLLGLRTLPQLLNQPLLSIMPGFVFGFLIDTLQHAGKVVEELGLIVAMIVGLGVLGSAWALAGLRWHSAYLALGFAAFGWLVVVGGLLPGGGAG